VNGDYFCWRYMWPRLAAYIGAKVTSDQKFEKHFPKEGVPQLESTLAEWAKDKRPTWDAGTWAYQDWVFQRTWSATLSINKARKFGWMGHMDSYDAFVKTFERMKALGQIPL
jgi:hypothetical protein